MLKYKKHFQRIAMLTFVISRSLCMSENNEVQSYMQLGSELEKIVAEQADSRFCSVYIKDLDHAQKVYGYNENHLLHVGATQMLLTSAVAIEKLGVNFRYKTILGLSGKVNEHGVAKGDLVIRGSGDPTIGQWELGESEGPTTVFKQWAEDIKSQGIQKISGRVLLDTSYFDSVKRPDGWASKSLADIKMAEVSALNFNGNAFNIYLSAGKRNRRKIKYKIWPDTNYFRFTSKIVVDKKAKKPEIILQRTEGSNFTSSHGVMLPKTNLMIRSTVHHAAQYFGHVLRETFASNGLPIDGKVYDLQKLGGDAITAPNSFPVIVHLSDPLPKIIHQMLLDNNTLTAEALLKTLGKETSGIGSFDNGLHAIQQFLLSEGMASSAPNLIDGSGQATRNSISMDTMVSVLEYMANARKDTSFPMMLPSPQESKSTQNMPRITVLDKQMHIMGYTGISGSSMAGYITTNLGGNLAFSIAINDPVLSTEAAEKIVEDMLLAILNSSIKAKVTLR